MKTVAVNTCDLTHPVAIRSVAVGLNAGYVGIVS
jgi:hypothetical protein